MRTTRLSELAENAGVRMRFPAKKLAVGLVLLCAATAVLALVDRVAPAAPPRPQPNPPPAAAKPGLAPSRKAPLAAESPISAGPLLVMAGVLAGAVGLIFVLKRVLRGSRHVPGGKKILEVRDVLAIGPKRAIYLIGLEHRNLVVGLSGDHLTLLSEYSEEAEAGAAEPAAVSNEGRTGEFFVTQAASEAAFAARPTTVPAPAAAEPARVDALVAGDVTVPPPEAAATPARAASAAPRTFPFAAVESAGARKPRAERVPHKFRQLLEQAAAPEGTGR
jgi:flagellar biogenesis protein FliO